jgi:hypothetical protein
MMGVRLIAARLATVLALLAGLLALVAAPASAADDTVVIKLPSTFRAGGSAGSVVVAVTKRTHGCVSVRTALGIRLPDLSPDQVIVQVLHDGRWRQLDVSDGRDGLLMTDRTAADRDSLCQRKSLTARYRLTFLEDAPSGLANLVAEAYTADGDLIDRATGARRVVGGRSPSATRAAETPTPSPTDQAGQAAQSPQVVPAASGKPGGGTGLFSMGTAVLLVGLAMVGVGIALLGFLVWRARADRAEAAWAPRFGPQPPPPPPAGGDGDSTTILPRVPY